MVAYCLGKAAELTLISLDVPWAQKNGGQIPQLLTYLAVASGVSRLCEVWLLTLHGRRERAALSRLSRTVLYGVALSVALFSFWISNGYTLLSVSTGAIAAGLAFAAQRTMGDLIAGIALSIEGAIRIDDWVQLEDGFAGEVVNIDWRATHLRGWDSAVRIVPNTSLVSQSFVKLPRRAHPYGQTYAIRVSGRENPNKVLSLLTGAVDRTDDIQAKPAAAIRLADATSDPYIYTIWVHFENYMSMFSGKDTLFRNIHDALNEAGLKVSPEVLEVREPATKGDRTAMSKENRL